MGKISDKDWEALHENFDTAELLSAVDSVDALRGYLNDRIFSRRRYAASF